MSPLFNLQALRFGEPLFLWLLLAPGLLVCLWCLRTLQRRRDVERYRAIRMVPVPERMSRMGELRFWLAAIAALTLTVVALARPQAVTSVVHRSGVDLVLLVDGSVSMRVSDMGTDRWQRAMQWVRTLTRTLSWEGDRLALATFAHIAVPQIRLTRDPNTVLFFLDYLERQPTFALDEDTAWDTNIEDAIYWGLKMVDADRRAYGQSKNAIAFVVISDGQVWSGQVERALREASTRGIAVDVVGIGTSGGGRIPLPRGDDGAVLAGFEPFRSTIDRTSLRAIAQSGGGDYFEIESTSDVHIATRIIQNAGRRAGNGPAGETLSELYLYAALAAAGCLALGTLLIGQRLHLSVQLLMALALMAMLANLSP